MRRSALYICYDHVIEPLVQTQVVAYLRELARRGFEIHLLTFQGDRLSAEKRSTIGDELAQMGIRWHALRYHRRPSLPATLYDIAIGTLVAMRICQKYDIRLIHARSHVPAAMGLSLKRILGCRFLFDLRGLLAEEYVDAGRWTESDLKYRLTKRIERAVFREADAFVMLTHRIKDDLVTREPVLRHRSADIEVIPCCVDTSRFSVSPEARAAYRRERGWSERRVLTYVGKLGTWYLHQEMARFFAVARRVDPSFFFQVLTQSDAQFMREALHSARVPPAHYDIQFASPDQLPLHLAASDVGISFIRAGYSKLASSPTKVGEYLAAGLPVVVSAGIGDSGQMLKDHRLGVVMRELSEVEYRRAVEALRVLLEDDETASRCRQVAEQELSLARVGSVRYASVYERLLHLTSSRLTPDVAETT